MPLSKLTSLMEIALTECKTLLLVTVNESLKHDLKLKKSSI